MPRLAINRRQPAGMIIGIVGMSTQDEKSQRNGRHISDLARRAGSVNPPDFFEFGFDLHYTEASSKFL
jgi:hypothetical protein